MVKVYFKFLIRLHHQNIARQNILFDIKILTLSFLFAIITLLLIPNNTKLTGLK